MADGKSAIIANGKFVLTAGQHTNERWALLHRKQTPLGVYPVRTSVCTLYYKTAGVRLGTLVPGNVRQARGPHLSDSEPRPEATVASKLRIFRVDPSQSDTLSVRQPSQQLAVTTT